MYSSTTLREVTVVDGTTNNSLPSSAGFGTLTGARTCGARARQPSSTRPASYSLGTFIFESVVTQRGSRCSLHKSLRRVRPKALSVLHPGFRRVAARCRSVHIWETDPVDARRRGYFGKIQIWNGWYSWVVSELRRLNPFLELVCACAPTAPPVLRELPPRRVARRPHLRRSFEGYRAALSTPSPKRWPHFVDDHLCSVYLHHWGLRWITQDEERRDKALREFRASLLPIVHIIVWNVKKYGAARACPRVRKSHHRRCPMCDTNFVNCCTCEL